jgi:hypothetical protein
LYVFRQIHEIVFNGQGGYDWNTVYNMPIWLRKYTFEVLKEHYDKQAEEANKQQKLLKNSSDLVKPNIVPKSTYTTKAPKK